MCTWNPAASNAVTYDGSSAGSTKSSPTLPVSSPDPLEIMHVAVTRTEPYVRDSSPFLPSEAMTLDQALYAYTMGSAHTSHHEDVTGSIEIGKYADLVVLDQDLTTATTLTDASVVMTMIEGVPVYQAPSF